MSVQVCFGAFLVQTWQGGSGTLRTDYPAVVSLVGAFFFPVGLIMLVLTGQELVTANFSEWVNTHEGCTRGGSGSGGSD